MLSILQMLFLPTSSKKPTIVSSLQLRISATPWVPQALLKVHKIENFFDSDFGICVISLLVRSKH
jgi:hypothetical protein